MINLLSDRTSGEKQLHRRGHSLKKTKFMKLFCGVQNVISNTFIHIMRTSYTFHIDATSIQSVDKGTWNIISCRCPVPQRSSLVYSSFFPRKCIRGRCSMYMRALIAISLQRVGKFMKAPAFWVYLIAFDRTTVRWCSYIDLRVRSQNTFKMCNFHFLAIPIYGIHTVEAIYYLIHTIIENVVSSARKHKLIGVSTDGPANIFGKVNSAVTRL